MTQVVQVKTTYVGGHSDASVLGPFWIAAIIAAASVVFALAGGGGVSSVTTESGSVEMASAFLWVFAAASVVWLLPMRALGQSWHVPALFLLFAARELDFDKKFLSQGILKARLYSGDAPLVEKLIGLTVIVLILVVGVRLVRRNWRDVIQGMQHGVAWVWAAVAAFVLAGTSKLIDGAGRKLSPYGIEISPSLEFGLSVAEETMELAFVIISILAVCLFAKKQSETAES